MNRLAICTISYGIQFSEWEIEIPKKTSNPRNKGLNLLNKFFIYLYPGNHLLPSQFIGRKGKSISFRQIFEQEIVYPVSAICLSHTDCIIFPTGKFFAEINFSAIQFWFWKCKWPMVIFPSFLSWIAIWYSDLIYPEWDSVYHFFIAAFHPAKIGYLQIRNPYFCPDQPSGINRKCSRCHLL